MNTDALDTGVRNTLNNFDDYPYSVFAHSISVIISLWTEAERPFTVKVRTSTGYGILSMRQTDGTAKGPPGTHFSSYFGTFGWYIGFSSGELQYSSFSWRQERGPHTPWSRFRIRSRSSNSRVRQRSLIVWQCFQRLLLHLRCLGQREAGRNRRQALHVLRT